MHWLNFQKHGGFRFPPSLWWKGCIVIFYTVHSILVLGKKSKVWLDVRKLANDKSPGLNDVPPDAFKALSNQNLNILLNFFNAYWREEIDFSEWHEGQVVPVPKSGDLSDPNKWRGFKLMNMGSKIFSSILCTRLFTIIDKHGVKYQFGSTPGVGCQDGSFTIKTLLRLRHHHNLPTYVLFADLVKAFDTSNHELMDNRFNKYGCPPALRSAITRMYKDSVVRLIIVKIDTSIPFQVGVKQVDIMAPVLFLFIIMGFSETLEREWIRNGLHMLRCQHKTYIIFQRGYLRRRYVWAGLWCVPRSGGSCRFGRIGAYGGRCGSTPYQVFRKIPV